MKFNSPLVVSWRWRRFKRRNTRHIKLHEFVCSARVQYASLSNESSAQASASFPCDNSLCSIDYWSFLFAAICFLFHFLICDSVNCHCHFAFIWLWVFNLNHLVSHTWAHFVQTTILQNCENKWRWFPTYQEAFCSSYRYLIFSRASWLCVTVGVYLKWIYFIVFFTHKFLGCVCVELKYEVTSFWLWTTLWESPNSQLFVGLCIHAFVCVGLFSSAICWGNGRPQGDRSSSERKKNVWVVLWRKRCKLLEKKVQKRRKNVKRFKPWTDYQTEGSRVRGPQTASVWAVCLVLKSQRSDKRHKMTRNRHKTAKVSQRDTHKEAE